MFEVKNIVKQKMNRVGVGIRLCGLGVGGDAGDYWRPDGNIIWIFDLTGF